MSNTAVLDLVKDLIARPSVTPADEDCQAALAARLERIGFTCETIAQGGVTNLWARRGSAAPLTDRRPCASRKRSSWEVLAPLMLTSRNTSRSAMLPNETS